MPNLTPLTPQDADRIKTYCEAATEGPWYSHEGEVTEKR